MSADGAHGLPRHNRIWPFAGGDVGDIGVDGRAVEVPLPPVRPDEVVARIDAVCICSSDIKIIRMGTAHPLFAERDLAADPVVLGHEIALTVVEVGADWHGRFRAGDRLGLQPSLLVDGKRQIVGMDLPGGFAEYIRLDGRVLGGDSPYVFPVPAGLSAATTAMLEPYSCVEAAYRRNCRTSLRPDGRTLVVCGPGRFDFDVPCPEGPVTLVAPGPEALAWAGRPAAVHAGLAEWAAATPADTRYDDILVVGAVAAADVETLLARLDRQGLIALVGPGLGEADVAVDPARIHYHELSLLGAPGPSVAAAFAPSRTRFELRTGGTALILGAGGAMGRIHAHRALEMAGGPSTVIASSRKGRRLAALREDFGVLAVRHGKTLVVVEDERVEEAVANLAPDGCDDVVVVAPQPEAIDRGARLMRSDGMLVLFAGTAFGTPAQLKLGRIADAGARFTGSTGSTVADQIAVLERIEAGTLELSGNLEAVVGLAALPEALAAVKDGSVCGKIAVYPANPNLPLTPIAALRGAGEGARWTRQDEQRLIGA